MSWGVAQAVTEVKVNQFTDVNVTVQNNADRAVQAAVRLKGYDGVGTLVGQLCKEVVLAETAATRVSYAWQAPAYATGLYWSPQIEVGGTCPNQDRTWEDDDSSDDD